MNIQELCDYAVQKMVEQGKRCMSPQNFCIYRDKDNNHCAVGHIMATCGEPATSSAWTSKYSVMDMADELENVELRKFLFEHLTTVVKLQKFHDVLNKSSRKEAKTDLSKHVNTSAKQYQQWVNMGSVPKGER